MQKIPASRLLLATSLLAMPATLWSLNALAAPTKGSPARRAKTRIAKAPQAPVRSGAAKSTARTALNVAALPKYVPMATIKRLQKEAKWSPIAGLQPVWEGHALKTPMRDLLTNPTFETPRNDIARAKEPVRIAQAFPRPVAPANPRNLRPRAAVVPRWVRYPLEFQLAGIAIGSRAVDKDRFNRIDRYGLFALHGNPTAVVRSIESGGGGGGATGGTEGGAATAPGGATAGRGGTGGATAAGGDAAGATETTRTNITLLQTPPETAALFPQSQVGGGLPDWALAVTVKLDNNHVEWLYKRDTYSMGFVVDRLGFVDAIIVAGLQSDIARTNLEDPLHTVKLGDDFRKVTFRYGYPDDIVPLAADPGATANDTTGAPGGAAGGGGAAAGGATAGAEGGAGAAAGGAAGATAGATEGTNGAFRTFDMRYEQSYNVVFTIRNNRVVRIYIFGDPDFFNAQRRNQIRTKY